MTPKEYKLQKKLRADMQLMAWDAKATELIASVLNAQALLSETKSIATQAIQQETPFRNVYYSSMERNLTDINSILSSIRQVLQPQKEAASIEIGGGL